MDIARCSISRSVSLQDHIVWNFFVLPYLFHLFSDPGGFFRRLRIRIHTAKQCIRGSAPASAPFVRKPKRSWIQWCFSARGHCLPRSNPEKASAPACRSPEFPYCRHRCNIQCNTGYRDQCPLFAGGAAASRSIPRKIDKRSRCARILRSIASTGSIFMAPITFTSTCRSTAADQRSEGAVLQHAQQLGLYLKRNRI